MKIKLRKNTETFEDTYNSLPEWKKKIWSKEIFFEDMVINENKTENVVLKYDNSDWT